MHKKTEHKYNKIGGEIIYEKTITAEDGTNIRMVAVKNADIMRNANIQQKNYGKLDETKVHNVNFIKIGNKFTLIH